jgi:hypothetical protein
MWWPALKTRALSYARPVARGRDLSRFGRMPSPHRATQNRLLDVEIAKVARDDLERLLRLRRVAALIPQTLDTLAKLTGAVLRFGNPLGNGDECGAVLGHVSTVYSL